MMQELAAVAESVAKMEQLQYRGSAGLDNVNLQRRRTGVMRHMEHKLSHSRIFISTADRDVFLITLLVRIVVISQSSMSWKKKKATRVPTGGEDDGIISLMSERLQWSPSVE